MINTEYAYRGTSLGYRYSADSSWVIRNLDFHIESNEIVCLVGANGSGKSTLAKLVANEIVPEEGEILEACKIISFRYQNYMKNVLPWYSAQRNLRLVTEAIGSDIDIVDWLSLGKYEFWSSNPTTALSGGQQQFLSIFCVIAMPSDLLVLDEPYSALDPIVLPKMWKLTRKWVKTRKQACLVITHNLDEALALGDRIVLLENARDGSASSHVLARDGHEDTDLLSPEAQRLREELTRAFYGLSERQ